MILRAFDDPHGWGTDLVHRARRRQLDAAVFTHATAEDVLGGPPAVVFMHLRQHPPDLAPDQALARDIAAREHLRLIPDIEHVRMYEDKLRQARAWWPFMPPTYLWPDHATAMTPETAIEHLGLPFISKAREGSASANCRIVRTFRDAARELAAVGPGGFGIPIDKGRTQHGYVIWQQLLRDNPYDYRVIRIGRARLVLQRYNRNGLPFASGSGQSRPIVELDDEQLAMLRKAEQYFGRYPAATFVGLDLVHDPDAGPRTEQGWRILECTIGWTLKGYRDCRFFVYEGRDRYQPLVRFGRDTWNMLLIELMAGQMC